MVERNDSIDNEPVAFLGDASMRIAVVGCGYVGLVTAACLAELGHQVVGVDDDTHKITLLSKG